MPYIYVMDRENGHMKIGFSSDPFRRLREVPGAKSVLATWDHMDAFHVEQAAHRLLRASRQDGEWFAIDRYTAFEAIAKVMREYDSMSPAERIVDLSGDYDVPAPPSGVSADRYRIGYLRPIDGVSGGRQMKWLLISEVSQDHIYAESDIGDGLDASLKDCREEDLFLAWSHDVFGARAAEVEALVQRKGATLVTANP